MTFKVNWEKAHTKHHLTDSIIKQMLAMFYPKTKIKNFEIIAGGCANVNVKVNLEGLASPIILSVYLREPSSAYKEQKIAGILKNKVSVPEIYHIAQIQGYTFAIAEYIPGITLRVTYCLGKKNVT